MLDDCGFERVAGGRKRTGASTFEEVWERRVHNWPDHDVRVRVWTSIVNGEARGVGDDSIKITCAAFSKELNGVPSACFPIHKATHVNRTGQIEKIVERTKERMRKAYGNGMGTEMCNCCGAPYFMSKKKNLVCVERCWMTDEQKRQAHEAFAATKRRYYRRNYRR